MAATDKIESGGLATFIVKSEGSALPDSFRVHSISIRQGVNRIPTAIITLLDGDVATGKFEASSSDTLIPGKKITIEAGYDNKNAVLFEGIVTKQSIRVDALIGSALEVECRDAAVKMIVGRKSKTYSKKKDSDVISSIISTYSGLSANVTATTTEWPEQVQYYATDWDFILTRAEANSMIVSPVNGKVSVVKPDADTNSVLSLTYGTDLQEFHGDLNAVNQLGSSKAFAWDYTTQKVINGEASNDHAGPGNLSSKKLSEVVGLSEYDLQTSAYLKSSELTDWSKAQMTKSEYAKIIATARCQGTDKLVPTKYVTLAGLGDRFNGDHFIAEVVHEISDGNWTTEVNLGLSSVWFSEEPDVMAPSAAGLLPGVRGLFNGTVKKMYEDPDSQYRILVELPLFDPNGEGLWARLANFYSTNGAGAFFLPEVGDEVVVGFLNEDPRFPIILGSLYSSSKNKPFDGLDPAEDNPKKAIVSKKGMYIQFDDKDVVLTFDTPNKNTIIISDKDKSITIKDQNSNSLEMTESGITMKSEKDINIQATQQVNIKGSQGVNIEASGGDVQVKGMNVKANADMQLSAEGGMTASVQGGTELTLKAAMVMIN